MFKKNILRLSLILFFFNCDNEPYEGPLNIENSISCETATEYVQVAENNFLDSDSTNYIENCLVYKVALEQQQNSCPELAANISEVIQNLNDCEITSFFKVDFDNNTFLALEAKAHISNGQLKITGKRNNEYFELILYETLENTYQFGTQNINNTVNLASYTPDSNSNEIWISQNTNFQNMGEITISEIDYTNLKISGVFNFIGINENDTKVFSNGVFIDIPLTKDNEFFALVDGEEFEDFQFLPYVNDNAQWAGFVVFNEGNTAVMDFTFDINTTPGVYNLGLIPQLPRAGYTSNPDYYYHGNGSITISAHNTSLGFIMGTFEFIAEGENATPEYYIITKGSFCITYFN